MASGHLRSPWSSLALRLAQLAARLRLDAAEPVEAALRELLAPVRGEGSEAWDGNVGVPHRKAIGKPWENCDLLGFNIYIYI